MKTGKIITGVAVGAVIALIMIPKTRKMISDAVNSITDSLKDLMDNASEAASTGKNEFNKISDKAKDVASGFQKTEDAWQS